VCRILLRPPVRTLLRSISHSSPVRDHTPDRLPGLAIELVDLNVDVIVTYATGVNAARRATAKIPIVAATAGDMVAMGIVASLAHPGGNITGSTFFVPELFAKRVELLSCSKGLAAPKRSRVSRMSSAQFIPGRLLGELVKGKVVLTGDPVPLHILRPAKHSGFKDEEKRPRTRPIACTEKQIITSLTRRIGCWRYGLILNTVPQPGCVCPEGDFTSQLAPPHWVVP